MSACPTPVSSNGCRPLSASWCSVARVSRPRAAFPISGGRTVSGHGAARCRTAEFLASDDARVEYLGLQARELGRLSARTPECRARSDRRARKGREDCGGRHAERGRAAPAGGHLARDARRAARHRSPGRVPELSRDERACGAFAELSGDAASAEVRLRRRPQVGHDQLWPVAARLRSRARGRRGDEGGSGARVGIDAIGISAASIPLLAAERGTRTSSSTAASPSTTTTRR